MAAGCYCRVTPNSARRSIASGSRSLGVEGTPLGASEADRIAGLAREVVERRTRDRSFGIDDGTVDL